MGDIHVLETMDGKCRVVFHFSVPAGDNAAGFSYQQAIKNSSFGGATSMPVAATDQDVEAGQITPTEKTAIESGQVLERSPTLRSGLLESGGDSPAQVLAHLQKLYAQDKAALTAKLQADLKWFGKTASEA